MDKTPRKSSGARLWFLVHSWMGLPLWAYVFFLCFTGTLASVSHEILWLTDPEVRAGASGDLAPASALIAAAEAAAPGSRALSVHWGADYMAATVRLGLENGLYAMAYVDPVSATVRGIGSDDPLPVFLRALHGWLLSPWTGGYPWGWYLVAVMAIPLLGSVVTGMVVYKRFWRAFFTRPKLRAGKGARVLLGDLHRLGGAWSLWFVLLIGVTGLWFLVQAAIVDLRGALDPGAPLVVIDRADLPKRAPGEHPPPAEVDAALAAAQATHAGGRVTALYFPGTAFDPIYAYGSGRVPLLSDVTYVHPRTAEVLYSKKGGDSGALGLASQILRPLHVGDFGGSGALGLAIKGVWFLFGLILSMLIFSGMLIWSKRTVRATLEMRQGAKLGESPSHA
ncbi:peptidase [Rhodospirillum rubrum]|uniref:PepSY-associated TM helix domain-containing protein n=1 Tax=Rhodospirillum rubrum TaxID=1085 RepID=UPI00190829BB|nr:PepSY-associated TM helix domain-containing protein [Rhodospirillum rubrum]MBK1663802.1 peptidase [Rhodospirillum rubrum]MBK1675859.1 peptidase [Rhodospirillum rubrum]